jgi:hypothetical protein
MKELKKFLVMFGLAFLVIFIGYKIAVRPCKYVTGNPSEFRDCTCLGKKINFRQLLGNLNPYTPPFREYCVGWVKNRTP